MPIPSFHLAFPVTSLEASRQFYGSLLGCAIGRESERWVDFDFFGHQVTAHLVDEHIAAPTNSVDGKDVPVSHFGMILEWDAWQALADRLRTEHGHFLIEPHVRFVGEPGEQATLFVLDPSGNGLEFKSFRDGSQIFAR